MINQCASLVTKTRQLSKFADESLAKNEKARKAAHIKALDEQISASLIERQKGLTGVKKREMFKSNHIRTQRRNEKNKHYSTIDVLEQIELEKSVGDSTEYEQEQATLKLIQECLIAPIKQED